MNFSKSVELFGNIQSNIPPIKRSLQKWIKKIQFDFWITAQTNWKYLEIKLKLLELLFPIRELIVLSDPLTGAFHHLPSLIDASF